VHTSQQHKRKQVLVDRDFQINFFLSRWFLAILISSMIIALGTLFAYVFKLAPNRVQGSFSNSLPLMLLAVAVVLIFFLVRWGIRISHRVAGPMINIRRQIKKVGEGDLTTRIHLRQGDSLSVICDTLNQVIESIEGNVRADRDIVNNLVSDIKELEIQFEKDGTDAERSASAIKSLARIRTELDRITSEFQLSSEKAEAASD
jgi:methyl-accepting chemotaxis protein